ncbi:MAG: lipoprotein [Bacteroidetes bacterium]|nr:MAG: lipoprotein [Bacteroidota bacterium]
MKKLALIALALTLSVITNAQFNRAIGSSAQEFGNSVIKTSDGGTLTVGVCMPSGIYTDINVIKTDAAGNIVWQKRYGSATDSENSICVTQLSSGAYIIGGTYQIGGSGSTYALLMKISATGLFMWSKRFGSGSSNSYVNDITATNDGGYIVLGSGISTSTGADMIVLKYTLADFLSWGRRYDSGIVNGDSGFEIIQLSTGEFVVAGQRHIAVDEAVLLKISSIGAVLWCKSYGTSSYYETANGLKATSDGGFIVTGIKDDGTNSNVFTFKTDGSGNLTWARQALFGSTEYGHDVVQTTDGGYAVASSGALTKYDGSGTLLWSYRYGGGASGGIAELTGGHLVSGGSTSSFGAGTDDIHLFRTDASGINCANIPSGATSNTPSINVNTVTITTYTPTIVPTTLSPATTVTTYTGTTACPCTVNAGPDQHDIYCGTTIITPANIGTAPVGGLNYSWSPTTALATPWLAQTTASPLPSDCLPYLSIEYTLTVSSLSGSCITSTDKVFVTPAMQSGCGGPKSMVHMNDQPQSWTVYPNPASGQVIIETGSAFSGEVKIRILDVTGKVIFEKQTVAGERELIDLNATPKGLYLVQISDAQQTQVQKLILE